MKSKVVIFLKFSNQGSHSMGTILVVKLIPMPLGVEQIEHSPALWQCVSNIKEKYNEKDTHKDKFKDKDRRFGFAAIEWEPFLL